MDDSASGHEIAEEKRTISSELAQFDIRLSNTKKPGDLRHRLNQTERLELA